MLAENDRVNRRVLGWALAMTLALYALLWVFAGPPEFGGLAPPGLEAGAAPAASGY